MYYSNGKILLSGEYLVLHGALALALPVKFGQSMELYILPHARELHWQAKVQGQFWFSAEFMLPGLYVKATSDGEIARRLRTILEAAQEMKPGFLEEQKGWIAQSEISFNRQWGFGSSSSLLSNIAYWAGVDPFELHGRVSQGSGFDIACARQNQPIFYQLKEGKRQVIPADFRPAFSEQLYFVYLGNKQESEKSVKKFLTRKTPTTDTIDKISRVTEKIASAADQDAFDQAIREHEEMIASVLQEKPVRESLFSDLEGEVKSLGAWGGDFVLISWRGERSELTRYLEKKELVTIFSYDALVL